MAQAVILLNMGWEVGGAKKPSTIISPVTSTKVGISPPKLSEFLSYPYKIEVMITSLKEMLEISNFGHMTVYTIKFESRDKFFLLTLWTEIMTLEP